MRALLAVALPTLLIAPSQTRADEAPRGFVAVQHEVSLSRNVALRYLLHLPEGYGKDERRWPLLLYLHGGMGRGEDFARMAWYPLIRMVSEGALLPLIVVAPQCPAGETWTDPERLIAVLDEVSASYRVDADRVYLAGYSMGGEGAWFLAYRHPERFAAVAAMSGPGNPWWSSRLAQLPVWAFHGAKDDRVPVAETEAMVEAIRKEGGDVRVSIDPDRGHSPPSPAEHEALLTWLLAHHRPSPPPTPSPGPVAQAQTSALGLPASVDTSALYLVYLHGRIVEEQGIEARSTEYGPYRYQAIVEALAARGFVVISEVRPRGTEVGNLAARVVRQVEALGARGVPPSHITVVGASKGGAIAARVSSLVGATGVNTVLMAVCNPEMEAGWSHDGICIKGHVLAIYDREDRIASSCRPLFERCGPVLGDRGEIELTLGSGHGVLYQPLAAWIEPATAWARAHAVERR
jgi:poly(3-hydroxybutyrate) depolymerase